MLNIRGQGTFSHWNVFFFTVVLSNYTNEFIPPITVACKYPISTEIAPTHLDELTLAL